MPPQALTISLPSGGSVAALLDQPPDPFACYVLAHGAGAGMEHPFLAGLAARLCEHGVAVLRFQFPFMQLGGRRARCAGGGARGGARRRDRSGRARPGLPLFAGGKSFGARMSSQAQAAEPLDGVRGLVFVGFPLHPAGKPAITRAEHLQQVQLPMLFLQGTRDALAELKLLRPVVQQLGQRGRCT